MNRNYYVIKLIQNSFILRILRVSNFADINKFYSYLSKQHLNTQKNLKT